jgi:hypothetical protein
MAALVVGVFWSFLSLLIIKRFFRDIKVFSIFFVQVLELLTKYFLLFIDF